MNEMTADPREVRGVSTVKFSRVLYVDPKNAVFLNRCLFTNLTVDSLTPIEVWHPESKLSFLFGTKKVTIELPVSEGWIEGRRIYQRRLKVVLICTGLIINAVCWLLYKLPPEIAVSANKEDLIFWAICGAFLSLIGIFWSRLKGPLSDPLAI